MAVTETLQKFYDQNHFVESCSMKLLEAKDGKCVMHMVIKPMHTNVYHFAHGGVLATLLDTAMGLAAAGIGRQIVTMNMNTSYIHSICVGEEATATARIIHNGRHSMVAEAEVRNQNNELIAKSTATMYIVGKLDPE